MKFIVCSFYHPPGTDETFFDKLNQFFCAVRGDFNVPSVTWDTDFPIPSTNAAKCLVDIILYHDLIQFVTHIQNTTASTLDLFFVNSGMLRLVSGIDVVDGISDHKLVCMDI